MLQLEKGLQEARRPRLAFQYGRSEADVRAAQNEARNLRIAVEEAHASLRELLANYRLKMDDRGLVPAIRDLVERFRQETGISVHFHNALAAPTLTPAQVPESRSTCANGRSGMVSLPELP